MGVGPVSREWGATTTLTFLSWVLVARQDREGEKDREEQEPAHRITWRGEEGQGRGIVRQSYSCASSSANGIGV